jgi:hypothetical protein
MKVDKVNCKDEAGKEWFRLRLRTKGDSPQKNVKICRRRDDILSTCATRRVKDRISEGRNGETSVNTESFGTRLKLFYSRQAFPD